MAFDSIAAAPASVHFDRRELDQLLNLYGRMVGAGHWRDGCTPEVQADWLSAFGSLALCKPYVRGVHWAHLLDAGPHQFPGCGLVDAQGQPKPALPRLRELRRKHLR